MLTGYWGKYERILYGNGRISRWNLIVSIHIATLEKFHTYFSLSEHLGCWGVILENITIGNCYGEQLKIGYNIDII